MSRLFCRSLTGNTHGSTPTFHPATLIHQFSATCCQTLLVASDSLGLVYIMSYQQRVFINLLYCKNLWHNVRCLMKSTFQVKIFFFFPPFISNQKALYNCFLWAHLLAWSSVIYISFQRWHLSLSGRRSNVVLTHWHTNFLNMAY